MKKWLLLMVLLTATPVLADSYEIGYVNPQGYAWRGDGYWYWGNQAYTRRSTPYTYYQYGRPYTSYRYDYYEYYPPKLVLPSYRDPEWKGKLLDVTAQLASIEGKVRATDLDNRAYIEALQQLGLKSNFFFTQGYGSSLQYPQAMAHNYNLNTFGANGNTVYGTQAQITTVADLYGSTDLNVLYQQASKLASNSQSLAGQATYDFSALVGQAGDNQARVAEIIANGQTKVQALIAAAEVLRAAESKSAHVVQQTSVFSTQPQNGVPQQMPRADGGTAYPLNGQNGQAIPQGQQGQDPRIEARHKVLEARCTKCHDGSKENSKLTTLNLYQYDTFDAKQRGAVYERLVTGNLEKRMPRKIDGTVDEPLSNEEADLFK